MCLKNAFCKMYITICGRFFKHALPSHNLVSTLSINCSKILTFCNFLTYILHFFQKYVEIPFILCYFSIVCYITIQHYSLESLYLNVKRRRCTAVYLLISQAKGQGTINACLTLLRADDGYQSFLCL